MYLFMPRRNFDRLLVSFPGHIFTGNFEFFVTKIHPDIIGSY